MELVKLLALPSRAQPGQAQPGHALPRRADYPIGSGSSAERPMLALLMQSKWSAHCPLHVKRTGGRLTSGGGAVIVVSTASTCGTVGHK